MRHLSLILGLGAAFYSADALACGGFFCSQTPVLQTAERIVFELDQDMVTAYVQLQYQGNDPSFAWIVPVPETPEVEIGVGQEMFDLLEAQTQPEFVRTSSGALNLAAPAAADIGTYGCGGGGSFGEPGMSLRYVPVPTVDVWKNERVGPFDVVTLSAETAEDVNNWLGANGYRPVPGSEPVVQEYLDAGYKLLALKLAPSADASAVEPIKMTYRDSRGCASIPVKLTAFAAVPGLEIVTWVFGESRAGPNNYESVEVPRDELYAESDYVPQMAAALDAAGGQGFVTEFASKTEVLNAFGDPALQALLDEHGYVTRLRSRLDPNEMTVDPELDVDFGGGDVSRTIELAPPPTQLSTGTFVLLALATIFVIRRRS